MRVLNLVTSPDAEFYQLQLRALRQRGIEETTLGVGDLLHHGDDRMDSRSVLDYVRFVPRAFRRSLDGYDLVHANYGLTAPAALARVNLPVVITLWGSDVLGPWGRLTRASARLADAVIVMSDEMAAALRMDCHVIPHGVDLQQFRPFSQRVAREVVGWSHDTRHVLFPYPKRSAVKDYPRAKRVVEAVREHVDEEIALQSVYGVPHARMPLYLNAADVLLLTSKREGSPNSVKEAMACNLPVVATDVGDVRERLAGVAPAAVCRTDGELVDGLVDALERGPTSDGRDHVRSLSIEEMGRRIEAVYESTLSATTTSFPSLGGTAESLRVGFRL